MAELPRPYAVLWRRLSEGPLAPALGPVLAPVVRAPDLGAGGRTLSHTQRARHKLHLHRHRARPSLRLSTPLRGYDPAGTAKGCGPVAPVPTSVGRLIPCMATVSLCPWSNTALHAPRPQSEGALPPRAPEQQAGASTASAGRSMCGELNLVADGISCVRLLHTCVSLDSSPKLDIRTELPLVPLHTHTYIHTPVHTQAHRHCHTQCTRSSSGIAPSLANSSCCHPRVLLHREGDVIGTKCGHDWCRGFSRVHELRGVYTAPIPAAAVFGQHILHDLHPSSFWNLL